MSDEKVSAVTWIVATIIALIVLRFLWRSYSHPSNMMTRQAANMNWVAIGRTDNPKGGKDVLLGRNGLVSKIDWRTGQVRLVKPFEAEPFVDYVVLERWLTLKDKEFVDTAEAYVRKKHAFAEMAAGLEPAFASEKMLEDVEKKGAASAHADEELYQFVHAVQERLQHGLGGESLHEIDESFRLTSPEYLKITNELFQTAIELGKSPTEVSTYLIMAFSAANEEPNLAPTTSVIVYLRGVINFLRNPT